MVAVISQHKEEDENIISYVLSIVTEVGNKSKRLQSENRISPDVMLVSDGLLMFTILIRSVACCAYSTYLA